MPDNKATQNGDFSPADQKRLIKKIGLFEESWSEPGFTDMFERAHASQVKMQNLVKGMLLQVSETPSSKKGSAR